ncbi:DNA-directed RNA polymerase subunit beta [Bacillus pinisoli]|uniref:DNA-directed RNA polymerase subunit beta n=1 Tax=Bacillus pinisoli TaxID=2901866 RepID=UPI00300DCD06
MMPSVENVEVKTREDVKKNKKERKEKAAKEKPVKIRIRLFPIWLRLLIIVLLLGLSLLAGVAVGYGIIGNGEIKDAFEESTWTHIIDLVKKK